MSVRKTVSANLFNVNMTTPDFIALRVLTAHNLAMINYRNDYGDLSFSSLFLSLVITFLLSTIYCSDKHLYYDHQPFFNYAFLYFVSKLFCNVLMFRLCHTGCSVTISLRAGKEARKVSIDSIEKILYSF